MRGREVVITGMGVVSPIANELNLFWEGLKAGQSGIARVQSMEDIDQYPVQIAGEVRDLEVEKYVEAKEVRKMDPYTVYGWQQLQWRWKMLNYMKECSTQNEPVYW